jgi:ABC-type cobalamin transport system permease subunit
MMRRIKIFFGCLLVIVLALPLLPGPGWLIVAEALAVLEREFVWARRLMDTLAHTHAEARPPDSRRPGSIPHPV